MISVLSIPRRYLEVIARSAQCPSWRWITIREIPPRHLDRVSVPGLVLVPTSAQASLSRWRFAGRGRTQRRRSVVRFAGIGRLAATQLPALARSGLSDAWRLRWHP